jgi:hypothetical protein
VYCYITHSGILHSSVVEGDVSGSRYYDNIKLNTVTCMSMAIDGFELLIGFIEHLYTQLVTTSNCSTIANSHFSVRYTKVFSACCIFIGCHLVMASSAITSSASTFMSLLAGNRLTTQSLLQLSPRLACISHKLHTLLTAISRLACSCSYSSLCSLRTDGTKNTIPLLLFNYCLGDHAVNTYPLFSL